MEIFFTRNYVSFPTNQNLIRIEFGRSHSTQTDKFGYSKLLNEIKQVFRTSRPRHFLRVFSSPLHSLKAFKYHYRRVSERDFVLFIAKQQKCSDDSIDRAYEDLAHNRGFWEETEQKLSLYAKNYGLQMTKELSALYLLVRLFQPNQMVETGVSAGVSSVYILSAMEDNNMGRLYSIDLPPDNLPEGKSVGWVVPDNLRKRWSLHIGNSLDLLGPVLSSIGTIDCFVHDSLHTYDHMRWEFNTAWKYLRPGGLFLSHDVGANDAFFDFMSENSISWSAYRVFHVLGGFIKP
jgi:predicted O-methyltransferase YrrM